jgi:hypothetical protein
MEQTPMKYDALILVAAVRFAIDPDVSRPVCEQADARNNHVSQTAIQQAGTPDVDPRVGAARCGRGKDGADSRTVGQARSGVGPANNLYSATGRARWNALLGNLLSAHFPRGEQNVDRDPSVAEFSAISLAYPPLSCLKLSSSIPLFRH